MTDGDKVWVVRDPSPHSELDDVLWETTAQRFAAYVVGTGLTQLKKERTMFHMTREKALADAQGRLKAR